MNPYVKSFVLVLRQSVLDASLSPEARTTFTLVAIFVKCQNELKHFPTRNQTEMIFFTEVDLCRGQPLYQDHRQFMVSISRLSAPSCHLLGKNAMGTFFSMRQLCLQSKWHTITENRCHIENVPIVCPVNGRMVLRVQG